MSAAARIHAVGLEHVEAMGDGHVVVKGLVVEQHGRSTAASSWANSPNGGTAHREAVWVHGLIGGTEVSAGLRKERLHPQVKLSLQSPTSALKDSPGSRMRLRFNGLARSLRDSVQQAAHPAFALRLLTVGCRHPSREQLYPLIGGNVDCDVRDQRVRAAPTGLVLRQKHLVQLLAFA